MWRIGYIKVLIYKPLIKSIRVDDELLIIFLQLFFIVPIISKIKLDWLILITVPMGFFINLGFIVYTIKQYINYNNQIDS